MKYEGRLFRPPSEARSLIVQATVGCSHNRCAFCDMYKEKQFRLRPLDDVLTDFAQARPYYPAVDRIFLADGDALICPTADLLTMLDCTRRLYPECSRVATYGSPRSILRKTLEELSALQQAGLGMVYLGLESGSDQVLQDMDKGETADQIVRAGRMVKQAGLKLSVTAISGLGGAALWQEHARETGRALSRMKPDYIGLLTLMMEGDTPLVRRWQAGTFALLSPDQVAEETILLLENLDCQGAVFRSNHASNYLALGGTLNADREAMITAIRRAREQGAFKQEAWRAL